MPVPEGSLPLNATKETLEAGGASPPAGPPSLASRNAGTQSRNVRSADDRAEARALEQEDYVMPTLAIPEPCYRKLIGDPTFRVIMAVIFGLIMGNFVFLATKTIIERDGQKVIVPKELGDGWFLPFVVNMEELFATVGKLWLKALKCIVLPMIIFAMIDAMIMMRSLPGAKMVAFAVVTWYSILPLTAGLEAIIYSNLLLPDKSADGVKPSQMQAAATVMLETRALSMTAAAGDNTTAAPPMTTPAPGLLSSLLGIVDNLIPQNLIMDMYEDNLLPIIIASLTFGILVRDVDEAGQKTAVLQVVEHMNEVVFLVIGALMSVTPIAISSLVFGAVANKGLAGLLSAWDLVKCVVVGLGSHFFIVYPMVVFVFGRRNPFKYFANAVPAFVQAIGTSSSAAALPVSVRVAIEDNKIAPHIANFVISLGATIGMDGTAIYLISTIIWIANESGIVLDVSNFITLALMAALSAAGSAPIPNASLILLQVISVSVGVKVDDFLGTITAVDWALDRLRTTVNVAGDQTVASIMDLRFGSGLNIDPNAEDDDDDEVDFKTKVGSFVELSKRSKSAELGLKLAGKGSASFIGAPKGSFIGSTMSGRY